MPAWEKTEQYCSRAATPHGLVVPRPPTMARDAGRRATGLKVCAGIKGALCPNLPDWSLIRSVQFLLSTLNRIDGACPTHCRWAACRLDEPRRDCMAIDRCGVKPERCNGRYISVRVIAKRTIGPHIWCSYNQPNTCRGAVVGAGGPASQFPSIEDTGDFGP
jgi:hypothetical protein